MGKKTNPHNNTLMYDQYLQIWGGSYWSVTDESKGGNCGILCINLWKNWTHFSTLCWEVEEKSSSKKAKQHALTFFCLHSIMYNSIRKNWREKSAITPEHQTWDLMSTMELTFCRDMNELMNIILHIVRFYFSCTHLFFMTRVTVFMSGIYLTE